MLSFTETGALKYIESGCYEVYYYKHENGKFKYKKQGIDGI